MTIYLMWGGLAFLYVIGKAIVRVARKSSRTPATIFDQAWIYVCTMAVCLFFGLMAGYNLGTHTEGGDEYMDAGETVVDYVPSDKTRWTTGIKTFLVVFPAAALGLCVGFKEDKKLTIEEREKIEREIDSAPQNEGW